MHFQDTRNGGKKKQNKVEEMEANCLHESRFEGGGLYYGKNEPLGCYESYLSGTMQTKKSSSPEKIHTPCILRIVCCVPTLHYLLRSLHFTRTTKQTFPTLSRSLQFYYVCCPFIHAITIGSGKKSRKDERDDCE